MISRKNVVIVRNAFAYDFGGGERFPVFLADILQKNGWHPTIVSRSAKLLSFADSHSLPTVKGWWWSRQQWSGIYTLLFPAYVIWQCILFLWYLALFLRLKPTAVHIQGKDDFIAATFAAKLVGSRAIWTDHADLKHIWQNVDIWYKNPIGKCVLLAAHICDAITLVSESERALLTTHLSKDSSILSKMQVIYNGSSDVQNRYANTKKNDVFTFCIASRLVKDKGISEAIEAFDSLNKIHPETELVILGDGPDADYFKKQAAHNSHILFAGHQSDPLSYIASSDVFVHPTYHEGFSVALVEASMLSKAIIATSVGGNVEIIHDNSTGLLVDAKDSTSLFQAMQKLKEDDALRRQLGNNARAQYEERFNFDKIVSTSFIPLYLNQRSTL